MNVFQSFEFTAKLPTRNKKGELVFEDVPELRPNMTPKEVLQAGSFGGTYFRPIKSSVTGYFNMFNALIKYFSTLKSFDDHHFKDITVI